MGQGGSWGKDSLPCLLRIHEPPEQNFLEGYYCWFHYSLCYILSLCLPFCCKSVFPSGWAGGSMLRPQMAHWIWLWIWLLTFLRLPLASLCFSVSVSVSLFLSPPSTMPFSICSSPFLLCTHLRLWSASKLQPTQEGSTFSKFEATSYLKKTGEKIEGAGWFEGSTAFTMGNLMTMSLCMPAPSPPPPPPILFALSHGPVTYRLH